MPSPVPETVSGIAERSVTLPPRAGLGAPLSVAPASAVAQRLPLGAPVRRPAAQPSSATSPGTAPSAPAIASGTPSREAPAPARALPVLSVARHYADAAEIPVAPSIHTADARQVAWSAGSASDAASATRPTLGVRPIRPGVRTQRDVARAAPGSPEAAVPARWASGNDLPATVRSVSPGPSTASDEGPVPLQRLGDTSATAPAVRVPAAPSEIIFPSRDASPGAATSGGRPAGTGGPASDSGPAGYPAVQRRSDAGSSPGFQSFSPAAAPGSGRPTIAPGAQAREPLALARPQAAVPGPAAAPATAAAPAVARIVAGPAPAAQPVVQTSPVSAGGSSAGGFTATPVVQRVDGAAPAAPSEEGRSESDLDELARALFGRFRTHLRAEVIHEREARGLSFDAF